jgi:type II secretory pathway pseudopilin PulG
MKMKKAFTLIELLVVMAIIFLFMGSFWPAFCNVRRHARYMGCMNNLKRLVDGAALWADNHDDWAIAGDWFKDPGENETESSLLPYITSRYKKHDPLLICPASRCIQFFQSNIDFSTYERRYTYAANGYITLNMAPFGEGSPGTLGPSDPLASGGLYGPNNHIYWTVHGVTTMAAIRKPAETVFFIDHEYYAAISWTFNPLKPYSSFPEDYRFKTRWHNIKPGDDYGIGMIGWVDGHCSPEPSDFASKIGPVKPNHSEERWRYYFYNH